MTEPSVPAFFALAPLSTVSQSGSAEVVRWDSALTPSISTIAVVAMGADALAGTFLAAMDRLLALPCLMGPRQNVYWPARQRLPRR